MLARTDLLVQNAMIAGFAGAAAATAFLFLDFTARTCLAFGIGEDLAGALAGVVFGLLIVGPAIALTGGLVVIVYGAPAALLLRKAGLEAPVFLVAAGALGGFLVAILFGWEGADARMCCLADGCAAAWSYHRSCARLG